MNMDAFVAGIKGKTLSQEQADVKSQRAIALEWTSKDKEISKVQADLLQNTEVRIQEKNC